MSWAQLKSILDENKAEARQTASAPPTSCPVCGDLLEVNQRGERNCPLGHYRWGG